MDGIPPEVLCDIFLNTLPSEHRIRYSESISSPLRVSHVCRFWRELALSFRELWSYLRIDHMQFSHRSQQELMVEIFDTWLARSSDGPINFVIFCHLSPGATIHMDHRCAEHIFTKLIENQHRWKDVNFTCRGVRFSPQFPGFKLTSMPLLTSLHMTLQQETHAVADFTQSSRLRYLEIRHDNFRLLTGGGMSHLEHVRLSFSFPEHYFVHESVKNGILCMELLKNAPSLRRLRIYTESMPFTSPLFFEEPILHAGIHELLLSEKCGSMLPYIVLDSVTLPSLRGLTYRTTFGGENLVGFFQRSTPPLTYLRLRCGALREETLINTLRLLPTLEKLDFSNVKLTRRFFCELFVPDGTSDDISASRKQITCPKLSYIHVFLPCSGTDTWLEALLAMAKSRASVLGTLKRGNFHTTDGEYRTFYIMDFDKHAEIVIPGLAFTLHDKDG